MLKKFSIPMPVSPILLRRISVRRPSPSINQKIKRFQLGKVNCCYILYVSCFSSFVSFSSADLISQFNALNSLFTILWFFLSFFFFVFFMTWYFSSFFFILLSRMKILKNRGGRMEEVEGNEKERERERVRSLHYRKCPWRAEASDAPIELLRRQNFFQCRKVLRGNRKTSEEELSTIK